MRVPKHTLRSDTTGQSLLSFQVDRLAPHFSQVLLLTGTFELDEAVRGQRLADPPGLVGEGPLAGLLQAMRASTTPWIALLAIDQPAVPATHYQRALEAVGEPTQAIVSTDVEGRIQWLCGMYRTALQGELERQTSQGVRAVKHFGNSVNLKIIPSQDRGVFVNLNTPQDAADHGWLLPE